MLFNTVKDNTELNELPFPWEQEPAAWPERFGVEPAGANAWSVVCNGKNYLLQTVTEADANEKLEQLETMHGCGLHVVAPVGLVRERRVNGKPAPALLVTVRPEGAVLLEDVLGGMRRPGVISEGAAALTAHLHLAGYAWGEQAMQGVMVQPDGSRPVLTAAGLSGSFAEELSPEQRQADVHAAGRNLAQLAARVRRGDSADFEPQQEDDSILSHYTELWARIERTRPGGLPDIEVHTRVLDMQKMSRDQQARLKNAAGLSLNVAGRVTHRDYEWTLKLLTGLNVAGEGARRMLRDLFRYQSFLEFSTGRKWASALAAGRWKRDVFAPAAGGFAQLKLGEACR